MKQGGDNNAALLLKPLCVCGGVALSLQQRGQFRLCPFQDCPSIVFDHVNSASFDVAGFDDVCDFLWIFSRGMLVVLFVIALASPPRNRV